MRGQVLRGLVGETLCHDCAVVGSELVHPVPDGVRAACAACGLRLARAYCVV